MRRNDLDICADILQVALSGAKKTHIVYKANLNFNIAKKYLRSLIDKGHLQPVDGGYYITTTKGVRFLEQYRELVACAQES
ncbi:hypothetical protein AC482_05960 [miscellaneous Crenarchaeota group-15 archaeon DG-45]|uniref:ArnR1-like winged helix-turn-helix domain-containing protein n=1 Tax=miscellaneous Crenarchaeota group-15 archaeon DG-45 TaxID=1685127 RepID=A0A0M0BMK4_9ARCH|nr:MAG: hypothetical protein AC482_05960 [miscellaneous Crenarchaeota group-15 archaeon DG-45]